MKSWLAGAVPAILEGTMFQVRLQTLELVEMYVHWFLCTPTCGRHQTQPPRIMLLELGSHPKFYAAMMLRGYVVLVSSNLVNSFWGIAAREKDRIVITTPKTDRT